MVTRKSINISGTYVVSINDTWYMYFRMMCTLYSKKLKGRTESYFVFFF